MNRKVIETILAVTNGALLGVVGIRFPDWRFWLLAVWSLVLVEAGKWLGGQGVCDDHKESPTTSA